MDTKKVATYLDLVPDDIYKLIMSYNNIIDPFVALLIEKHFQDNDILTRWFTLDDN